MRRMPSSNSATPAKSKSGRLGLRTSTRKSAKPAAPAPGANGAAPPNEDNSSGEEDLRELENYLSGAGKKVDPSSEFVPGYAVNSPGASPARPKTQPILDTIPIAGSSAHLPPIPLTCEDSSVRDSMAHPARDANQSQMPGTAAATRRSRTAEDVARKYDELDVVKPPTPPPPPTDPRQLDPTDPRQLLSKYPRRAPGPPSPRGGSPRWDEPDELAKGSSAYYTDQGGTRKVAKILSVHYDDPPPYYTISIDGKERSTVRSKLTPIPAAELPPPSDASTAPPMPEAPTTAPLPAHKAASQKAIAGAPRQSAAWMGVLALLLAAVAAAASQREDLLGMLGFSGAAVTVHLDTPTRVDHVSVEGSWDDYRGSRPLTSRTPPQGRSKAKHWDARLFLPCGETFHYRFVIDGRRRNKRHAVKTQC